jgi:hypothetical protein
LICDDFNHNVTINESWTADVFTLNDMTTPGTGALTPNPSLSLSVPTAYQEAGWLYLQLANNPQTVDRNTAINYAIWGLFSNSAETSAAFGTSYGDTLSALQWQQTANTVVTGAGFDANTLSSVRVYSPCTTADCQKDWTAGQPQQYLGQVPEPGSLVLLGSGMAGLWASSRKRLRKPHSAIKY